MKELTQEYLKSLLDYDSSTGVFVWKGRPDKNKTWNTRYAGKEAGWNHSHGYLQICIDYKKYFLHRLAWFYVYGEWPSEIDHIDLNKKNNCITNLREASHQNNTYNRIKHKDNNSGYKGVTWDKKHNKWIAQINYNKKGKFLGFFACPEEAHVAYCKAAKKYHGEFARTA